MVSFPVHPVIPSKFLFSQPTTGVSGGAKRRTDRAVVGCSSFSSRHSVKRFSFPVLISGERRSLPRPVRYARL
jgi:hypothetical protein